MDMQSPTGARVCAVAGASVSPGGTIPVTFTATDNVSVSRAEVLFDVNGDGVIDDVTETFAAAFTAPSTFTVTIPATSGPAGTRTLTAVAFDPSDNPGVANVRINVGSVAPGHRAKRRQSSRGGRNKPLSTAAGLDVGTITRQTSPTVPLGCGDIAESRGRTVALRLEPR